MISSAAAQEQLRSIHNSHSLEEQLKRLQKLPAEISKIGQVLIQAGPEWKKLQKESLTMYQTRRQPFMHVGNLKTKQRQDLFKALFPQTADSVEDTWNLFDRLPYQSSYVRRPFRNPSQVFFERKMAWLHQFIHFTKGYERQDVSWLAAWASHLAGYYAPDALGYLFAAVIDQGGEQGDEIFNILISSSNGAHETGMMGRHVVRGLLCSSRPEGWEYIEKLLLAAQREEGLRQSILEAIDEAHPQAFRRMLRIVIDKNLSRFSAAIRAFSVWFGLPFEAVNPKITNKVLEQILSYLESPSEITRTLHHGEPQDIYYALWAMAFDDVLKALPHAVSLSHSSELEKRYVAIHMLAQMNLKGGLAELLRALDDEDLRLPARALMSLTRWEYGEDGIAESDLFERLERLLPRIKNKQNNLKPLVWDWSPIALDREMVSSRLIECLGNRSPKRLIPYLGLMKPWARQQVAKLLTASKQKDEENLQTLLTLVADPSPGVREEALKGLHGISLKESDVLKLEGLLARQAEDLRRGVIQLLLGLPDKKLLVSVNRLLHGKGEKERLVALEMLRECKQKDRLRGQTEALAREHQQRPSLSDAESRLLEDLLGHSPETFSLENALGLMDPQKRTKPVPPQTGIASRLLSKTKLATPSAIACLKSLDALVEEHRNDPIEIERGNTKVTELLGNIRYGWELYGHRTSPQDYSTFAIQDLVENWQHSRPAQSHDADGYELLRAWAVVKLFHSQRTFEYMRSRRMTPSQIQSFLGVALDFDLKYRDIVSEMIHWLVWAHPQSDETDFILHVLEQSVAAIPNSELMELKEDHGGAKTRALSREKLGYLDLARWQRGLRFESWNADHHVRLWKVLCWLNEPRPNMPGDFIELDDALFAYQSGAASRDDLLFLFLGSRNPGGRYSRSFWYLSQYSPRKPYVQVAAQIEKFPILKEIVDECRERILDVECKRGELPTAATGPAMSIRSVPGMKNLFRMLVALGDADFARGYIYGQNRSGVFSHLIRNSYPLEGDTPEDFSEQVGVHKISETRLIELAVYAPQWVRFVQHATAWEHLSDAVWWMYAHTKDRQWAVERDISEEWKAWIAERTPLTGDDLMDGAVDVAWFQRVYSELGGERWQQLYEAALYSSNGIGHTRARLYADAMLGKITAEQCAERIKKKRHQDSVRALGLIPLREKKSQKAEILSRYEGMQEFLRTGKKFGSQRKASERLAVSIGMQNLARTAGYADPQRLEWAMEIEAVSDLAAGPVKLQVDDFLFSLGINELGEPLFEARKKDKILKTIPAAIRKNEQVSDLLERKQKLDRQVSRMRLSMEMAMCRDDEFTAGEIQGLFRHPMLRAMLEQLVFISPHGLGYPIRSGKALFCHDQNEFVLGRSDSLRIAHAFDLLESREWHHWQRECFISERIQPFKQVFRELYVLTSAEKQEGSLSRRYAGQQVNPRQAVALFGGRGWVVDHNEGVLKTFHDAGISARVGFLQGAFTPAEVEGLTIETVGFTKRGEWSLLPLDEIPVRIFSEVMRDLDLVVSVAHTGGVDPESSASSVEARAALIRESCKLLSIANVELSERHVMINGRLANYNVNLGSGVVHKQPGGALCIIPVHSQYRGRLFLPFVDSDPKTAEVVSKVILLARDDQIKDPTILEQIL